MGAQLELRRALSDEDARVVLNFVETCGSQRLMEMIREARAIAGRPVSAEGVWAEVEPGALAAGRLERMTLENELLRAQIRGENARAVLADEESLLRRMQVQKTSEEIRVTKWAADEAARMGVPSV